MLLQVRRGWWVLNGQVGSDMGGVGEVLGSFGIG